MKAAVLERIGQPLQIMDLEIPNLESGQVLVRVLCSGICGSQLQEIDGNKGDPLHLPHLLGHEGCGIVESISSWGIPKVRPRDKVIIHWRKGAGMESELPVYEYWDGNEYVNPRPIKAGPCTTFSEYTIVSENRVTRIDNDVPDEFAALLGCCLSTALAIIENEVRIESNHRILVIGCGGVGLALILAASRKKPKVIWAKDISDKSELVHQFGAFFAQEIFPSDPFDVIIDTVGNCLNRVDWLKYGGKYISLQAGGSSAGGFNPTVDIPRYVQMWRNCDLDGWEKIITHRLSLERINEGIQLMRDGKAGRVMIHMSQ